MFISRFCSDIMHPELEALWNEIRGSAPEAAE
jgi:hypothetical protein